MLEKKNCSEWCLFCPQHLMASITLHLLNDSESLALFWLSSGCFQRRSLRPLSIRVEACPGPGHGVGRERTSVEGSGQFCLPTFGPGDSASRERPGKLQEQWLKLCLRLQYTDSLLPGSSELRAALRVGEPAGQCPAAPPGSCCFLPLPGPMDQGMLLGFPALQAGFPRGSRSPSATGRKLSLYHSHLSRALMIPICEMGGPNPALYNNAIIFIYKNIHIFVTTLPERAGKTTGKTTNWSPPLLK